MDLPDPGMPPWVWHAASGESVDIGSICLDWVLTGTTPPLETTWERSLVDNLAILGVNVLQEDCDATLRIALETSRTSATYGLKRLVCWSGEALQAEASLSIDGDVQRSWALVDRESPPPETIELWQCDAEDDPLGPSEDERVEWWHLLFSDVFGIATDVVTWIEDSPDGGPLCWESTPTEDDVRALASLLLSPHSGPTRDWLSHCMPGDQAERDALRPLVPYLITSDSGDMLGEITGQTFGSREDWWGWWEDQQ